MKVNNKVDAVIGLDLGDEGKGKITQALLQQRNYDVCARFNGGPNAGHTIYLPSGEKQVNHQLPMSAGLSEVSSYIGPGCVLDWGALEDEISKIPQSLDNLYISPRVPLISKINKKQDDYKGSTKKGIAPAYGDFYARKSQLAGDLSLIHQGRELVQDIEECENLLLEGAQAFYLDPHWGNYPWTSSSIVSPAVASATFGFNPKKFDKIYGVAKAYRTAVGNHPDFFKDKNNKYEDVYNAIQHVGSEFGATTGRRRHVQFLDLDALIFSINQTSTSHLILNKCDVLQEVNEFHYWFNGDLCTFNTFEDMQLEMYELLFDYCDDLKLMQCFFSKYPEEVL